jgi:hypothetical protein
VREECPSRLHDWKPRDQWWEWVREVSRGIPGCKKTLDFILCEMGNQWMVLSKGASGRIYTF